MTLVIAVLMRGVSHRQSVSRELEAREGRQGLAVRVELETACSGEWGQEPMKSQQLSEPTPSTPQIICVSVSYVIGF
jgi:hypothetical protein